MSNQWLAHFLYTLRRVRQRRRTWLYIGDNISALTGDEYIS